MLTHSKDDQDLVNFAVGHFLVWCKMSGKSSFTKTYVEYPDAGCTYPDAVINSVIEHYEVLDA